MKPNEPIITDIAGLWPADAEGAGMEVRLSLKWKEEAGEGQRKKSKAKVKRRRLARSRTFEEVRGGKLFLPGVLAEDAPIVERELADFSFRLRRAIHQARHSDQARQIEEMMPREQEMTGTVEAAKGQTPSGRTTASELALPVEKPEPQGDEPEVLEMTPERAEDLAAMAKAEAAKPKPGDDARKLALEQARAEIKIVGR